MSTEIIIEASPSRVVHSLSHIGYSLQSSICDLIDNSISHGKADNIYVYLDYNLVKKKFLFMLLDNGISMNEQGLLNAMKFGSSDEDYDPDSDLGKFGMGLKTASMAHSDVLQVVAKSHDSDAVCFALNKKDIKKKDKWVYSRWDKHEIKTKLKKSIELIKEQSQNFEFNSKSYTLIIWEGLIELNSQANKFINEGNRINYILRTQNNIESHIRMVFNRFLNATHGAKKVSIFFNGEELDGWDPCQALHPDTIWYKVKNESKLGLTFKFRNSNHDIFLRRYILPKDKKDLLVITEKSQNDKTMKIDKWQGLYFYRNNRLIDYGGWFDGTGTEPHITYARCEVDLCTAHDKYFTLNINKTEIKGINEEFKQWLKKIMPSYKSKAKSVYGNNPQKVVIKNNLRKNLERLDSVIENAAVKDVLMIEKSNEKNKVKVTNSYGNFFDNEISVLSSGNGSLDDKIGSENLNDNEILWKVIPNVETTMTVKINNENELFKLFYNGEDKNQRITAVIDAILIAVGYAELCIKTEEQKAIFENINRTVGHLLNRLIKEGILK